ncbi:MAG: SIR2 family protein [Methanothrix sp.]
MKQDFPEWRELRFKLGSRTKPLLLLGAGASVESGGRTAPSIVKELLRRLFGNSSKENQIMFNNQYGIEPTFDNVLDKLGESGSERRDLLIDYFQGLTPSKGYEYLASLLKGGYFYPIVISLNFDTLLEDAIRNDRIVNCTKTIEILLQDGIPKDCSSFDLNKLWLVKLHGDINQPESLRITRRETSELSTTASKLLEHLLVSQGMVSVGYRGSDRDVLRALLKAEKSAKTVFWTAGKSDSPKDRDLAQFLREQSAKYIRNTKFDELFFYLGHPFEAVQLRRKYRADFENCWMCLSNARGYTKLRSQALHNMDKLLNGSLDAVNILERNALKELLSYEKCGHLLEYRLRQSVAYLENALDEQDAYLDRSEYADLAYRLIEERLNVFLAADAITERRNEHLLKAIDLAEELEIGATKYEIIQAKISIKLGEMLKENAMLSNDLNEQEKYFKDAREKLSNVICSLSKSKELIDKYYLAAAHRHIGVTFELEGEITKTRKVRTECYRKWLHHSEKAHKILRELKEDNMLSYAGMNIASSLTRIASEERSRMEQKRDFLDRSNKLLVKILKPLKKLDDHRGLGWAHYHICENLRTQVKDAIEDKERLRLLLEVEAHAYCALIELRQTQDRQALGLAYGQLGLASYEIYEITGLISEERFHEAFWALNQAIERIEHGWYHQATAETCDGLSRYYKQMFKNTGEKKYLSKSIEWGTKAIINVSNRLGPRDTLCPLLKHLDQELERLIQI